MPRPSNTAERRIQIARALLRVMAKRGYAGASIADVAEQAKIAPGLVHYHFKTKLEILVAAVEELGKDYDARLDRLLARAAGDSRAELRAFVEAHLHVGSDADAETLACWIDMSSEAVREQQVEMAVGQVMWRAYSRLRDIIVRGRERRVFVCAEPQVATVGILAAIHGYFVLSATARTLIPPGSATRATLAMCDGLLGSAKANERRRLRKRDEKSRVKRSTEAERARGGAS
jgi:TetR/AcrR family transcriptional repressor of bet genes